MGFYVDKETLTLNTNKIFIHSDEFKKSNVTFSLVRNTAIAKSNNV